MPTLSTKELSYLNEKLNAEQVLIKKCHAWADQCTDQQLCAKYQTIAGKHQKHYDTLLGHLN